MSSSLLSVKARVLQHSIEKLEARILGADYEDKDTDNFLIWRKRAIRSEEIYDITQYDTDKCIIQLYEGDELLVKESFQKLFEDWQEAKQYEDNRREDDLVIGEESEEDFQEDEDDEENEN